MRDDLLLDEGIRAWAAQRLGVTDISAVEIHRPKAGWSNETLLVRIAHGGGEQRLVLRLPPLVAVYPVVDPHAQAAVHRAVRGAGLPAPDVVAVEDDTAYVGAPFLALAHVDGRTVADVPGLDLWLTGATTDEQTFVEDQYIEALACLHAVDWMSTDVGKHLRVGVTAELDYWADYVVWAADGDPASQLVDAIAWCRERAPEAAHESLLWGDARFGNVMYDESSRALAGLLDWELASIGPAEMDLAWHLALDELSTRVARSSLPGFAERADFIVAYEHHLGRRVGDLGYHEVFALVRAAAVNDREARIAHQTGSGYPGTYGNDTFLLREVAKRIAERP